MDINTCYETTYFYHTIAYYSHLVPTAIGLFLSIYALIRTKFSRLAVVFFAFTFGFSLWLIGDLIVWTQSDYNVVYYFWSWLDFVNVVFFVLGAYFFGLLARGHVSVWEKGIMMLLTLPAFAITVTGNSVVDFYQPVCEAANNDWLTYYKLFAETSSAALMLVSFVLAWKGSDVRKRVQVSVIGLAILMFYGVFAGTEYIASMTGVYETNLYGLFILPLFLIIMTFAITDLRLFQFRFVGTQILAYILIIMVGSQLLYVQDATDQTLSLVTLAITLFIGLMLIENAKREAEARVQIEELAGTLRKTNSQLDLANAHLKELDQMKDEFLSIASHQLRAPITAVRGYAANLADGTYGVVPEYFKEPIETIMEATRMMATSIEDYLNISRIEQGRMKYEKSEFDLAHLVETVVQELGPIASKKDLTLTATPSEDVMVRADIGKIKQVIVNIVDNAIKYTEKGGIKISIEKEKENAQIVVTDTGVGIPVDEIAVLFDKFTRARGANKINTTGTGLGLYVAKQLVAGHSGKVWAESDGPGKGSRFIIELPRIV
ncbi:MAG: HAMP domain-containing sensor histidine kinase [Patescibacteria group bacterium]